MKWGGEEGNHKVNIVYISAWPFHSCSEHFLWVPQGLELKLVQLSNKVCVPWRQAGLETEVKELFAQSSGLATDRLSSQSGHRGSLCVHGQVF